MKRTLLLDGIDPLTLYGINNAKFHIIAHHFAGLSLVARGDEIVARGSEELIEQLDSALDRIARFYTAHGQLTELQLQSLLQEGLEAPTPGPEGASDVLVFGARGKSIRPITPNQHLLISSLAQCDLVFAVGPAGTGKTYMAIALAVAALKRREVKRIVLTRPAVEAGERLGFLPGDLKEKLDPYLQPLYDALNDMLPPRALHAYLADGTVQIAPLAYMRGRTLDHAFVILDEAQNATLSQMKMFLTRMGRNAKFIVTGDTSQIDLPSHTPSGLVAALRVLRQVEGVAIVPFEHVDIVRHPLVGTIVDAFAAVDEQANHPT